MKKSDKRTTPLDLVLKGLEDGLRNRVAQLFLAYAVSESASDDQLKADIGTAVDDYHTALEAACGSEDVDFDILSREPERETTGADYGRDDP